MSTLSETSKILIESKETITRLEEKSEKKTQDSGSESLRELQAGDSEKKTLIRSGQQHQKRFQIGVGYIDHMLICIDAFKKDLNMLLTSKENPPIREFFPLFSRFFNEIKDLRNTDDFKEIMLSKY